MIKRNSIRYIFTVCIILTALFLISLITVFLKNYHDPRWRVFDFNSHQATEGDIYNTAEIPAVKDVRLSGKRTLRFSFTPPIKTNSWTVRSQSDNHVMSEGKYPEIHFPDEPYNETFDFIPEGVSLNKDISIRISFYPQEKYEQSGLSWPDNYFSPYSSVQFSFTQPCSIDEWTGLPENDPELTEARQILNNTINMKASALEKSEQVFSFVMEKIINSGGTPSDEMQNATPLETYRMLSTQEGRGWCENRALVYYLFANAAGVKTRLVDVAGKFGPLKLTGHYFCESWNPDQHRWYFVDPQSSVAYIKTEKGLLLNTLEIKRLFDVDVLDNCTVLAYNRETGSLETQSIEKFYTSNTGYFKGEIVIAYKFGYPKNRSYSRLKHFICYPTLLYAPFALPKLYLIKNFLIAGFLVSGMIALISGSGLIVSGHRKRIRKEKF